MDTDMNHTSPQQLLEAVIPGYRLISAFFMIFQIDITKYVASIAILVGLAAGLKYAYWALKDSVLSHFICTVEVPAGDEMYNFVMSWVAAQPFAKDSRAFVATATTGSRKIFRTMYSKETDSLNTLGGRHTQGNEGLKGKQNIAPVYITPGIGRKLFWFHGQLLCFTRSQERQSSSSFPNGEGATIYISCLGRNPKVLKDLIDDARMQYFHQDLSNIIIFRAAEKYNQYRWKKSMSRPSRPIDTVVMDPKTKRQVLADMEEYLHPATRKFYSDRGIPYRRGYLFRGPPGTGKSSLSFALAGIFGLSIFTVSLNSKISEDDLANLFDELPEHCLVLLEDIDTAGIEKRAENGDETNEPNEAEVEEVLASTRRTSRHDKTSISLSSLLNVIDGVASQEGRILVMTTNHMDNLDEALIRPGRVDLIVDFPCASRTTAEILFQSIFRRVEKGKMPESESFEKSLQEKKQATGAESISEEILTPPPTPGPEMQKQNTAITTATGDSYHSLSQEKINQLSANFGNLVPPDELSPAELQGFLLTHKRHPEQVIADFPDWARQVRNEKEKRRIAEERKNKLKKEVTKRKLREALSADDD
jgi:chaperone BCS1